MRKTADQILSMRIDRPQTIQAGVRHARDGGQAKVLAASGQCLLVIGSGSDRLTALESTESDDTNSDVRTGIESGKGWFD